MKSPGRGLFASGAFEVVYRNILEVERVARPQHFMPAKVGNPKHRDRVFHAAINICRVADFSRHVGTTRQKNRTNHN
nr:MAG TPA: hypothetical protein [Caudoviricetes sp.]